MKRYKGYTGSISFSEDDMVFHGRVVGIEDVVTFEARTAEDLVQAFHDSVDDYLDYCAEDGVDPQKPFSGKIALRTSPELHAKISRAAARRAKSINQWICDALEKSADADADGPTDVG